MNNQKQTVFERFWCLGLGRGLCVVLVWSFLSGCALVRMKMGEPFPSHLSYFSSCLL